MPNKQCQAVTRRECPTKYFIRPCGKDDKQICSRVPQEQCKDISTRKCSTFNEKTIPLPKHGTQVAVMIF